MTVRVLVALLALATSAWFAIGVRQAQDTARASAIISSGMPLSARQMTSASDLLKSAAFLNPDRAIDVLRAQLDLERGDAPRAWPILQRVVDAEPKNLEAWLLMERALSMEPASSNNVKAALRAAYAINHLLAPPVTATR